MPRPINISRFVLRTFDRWLRKAKKELSDKNVVLKDEILQLEKARERIKEQPDQDHCQSMIMAFLLPLLDLERRDAARYLNKAVAKGIPATAKARQKLAEELRRGWFGYTEQSIRETVRCIFPKRGHRVREYVREGKPIKSYWRVYGDPAEWLLPLTLLSKNARELYPYILAAPIRKASNWHKRRY